MFWLLWPALTAAGPPSPTYFLPDALPDEAGQASIGVMSGVGKFPSGDFPSNLLGGMAHIAVAPADDWQFTGRVAGFYESTREEKFGHLLVGGVAGAWSTSHQAQHVAPWVGYAAGMNFDEVAPSGVGSLGVSADVGAARGLRFDAAIPVLVVRRHRTRWSMPDPLHTLAASEVGVSWSTPRDRVRLGAHSLAVTGFSYRHVEPRWMVGAMVGTTVVVAPSVMVEAGLRF